jgi:sugar transferase EpsL
MDMVKTIIDILGSIVGIIIFGPIMIILAILVRIKLGSPIIFYQVRPGLGGKYFKCYKFRTMTSMVGKGGRLLSDRERLTSFGKRLRSTSLDELPSLINVLKGEMSLVGPRPLLTEYLALYSSEQARRHDVKPGITGWAQVNGRNAISWNEKFEHDIFYVDNRSFLLDMKIIFKTILIVFDQGGITQKGHVTVEHFKGNMK